MSRSSSGWWPLPGRSCSKAHRAAAGLQLTSQMQARIALLFALPVLELGAECLDGFNEILLYPTPFVVEDEWQDEIGLVHSGPVVQSGQSWEQGRSCSTGKTCRTLSIFPVSIW